MVHYLLQILVGYVLWKYLPSWLRLNNSRIIDHYIIIALSLIGILTMLFSVLHIVERII